MREGLRSIPGTEADWAGMWVRQVSGPNSGGVTYVVGNWHVVAGIQRNAYGDRDRFILVHGTERPSVDWAHMGVRIEVCDDPNRGTPPGRICGRCIAHVRVAPTIYEPSMSDEDIDRIARRVVELAREAEHG